MTTHTASAGPLRIGLVGAGPWARGGAAEQPEVTRRIEDFLTAPARP